MLDRLKTSLTVALAALVAGQAAGQRPLTIDYEVEAVFNTSSGRLAPYYIMSNRHGMLTQRHDAILDLSASKSLKLSERFSYGFGAEAVVGYQSKASYRRFVSAGADGTIFSNNSQGPAAIFLQQLYGEIKYRSLFLTAGMKHHESALLNFNLSSGDLTESGNARPIPEVRVGFIDFQNIPLTNGWLQIEGVISYGKFADNDWIRDHFSYYSGHIVTGSLYTYKRCYFRTKPSQPLSVTFGMQAAGLFGGTTDRYRDGQLVSSVKNPQKLKTFFKMFLPTRGGSDGYYDGNSLGSWDVMARYQLPNGARLKAYVEKPWEDGSGIGWKNGFDGVWGVEYAAADHSAIINGAVVEYLDFTNQPGPMHWAPGDFPGTTITGEATGADAYYNNYGSNSYANYGMGIGTPFLPAPIYNNDGYPAYVNTRVRGFHVGLRGSLGAIDYRLLGGYRKGWGDGRVIYSRATEDTSMMIEGIYKAMRIKGLTLKAQLALDSGSMLGDNFGALLSVSYRGDFCFNK